MSMRKKDHITQMELLQTAIDFQKNITRKKDPKWYQGRLRDVEKHLTPHYQGYLDQIKQTNSQKDLLKWKRRTAREIQECLAQPRYHPQRLVYKNDPIDENPSRGNRRMSVKFEKDRGKSFLEDKEKVCKKERQVHMGKVDRVRQYREELLKQKAQEMLKEKRRLANQQGQGNRTSVEFNQCMRYPREDLPEPQQQKPRDNFVEQGQSNVKQNEAGVYQPMSEPVGRNQQLNEPVGRNQNEPSHQVNLSNNAPNVATENMNALRSQQPSPAVPPPVRSHQSVPVPCKYEDNTESSPQKPILSTFQSGENVSSIISKYNLLIQQEEKFHQDTIALENQRHKKRMDQLKAELQGYLATL